MNNAIFSACRLSTEDAAGAFFSSFGYHIDIFSVAKKFDCAKQICIIGNTSISRSTSATGWAFEQKPEFEALLFTVPDSGRLIWETPKNKYESQLGSVFVIDQKNLIHSKISPQASYISIFVLHEDMFQCLRTLIDVAPKAKINFKNSYTDAWVGRFLTNLADTALSLSGRNSIADGPFLRHLKETLLTFLIYNLDNNYSQLIRSQDTTIVPAPHSIKSTMEYIDLHFSEALTSADLALQANISIRGLQIGFKKYKNTTVNNYIRHVRLTNARKMILDDNLFWSLQQIAYACGFSNYYSFCKYYFMAFSERPQDAVKRKRPSSIYT